MNFSITRIIILYTFPHSLRYILYKLIKAKLMSILLPMIHKTHIARHHRIIYALLHSNVYHSCPLDYEYYSTLHTMFCFYVIYRYMFSEWRSIRPMEINQYDITMATHYDITMGIDIARDFHCEITMGNDVHCDVTMSNGIDMCIYHGITMNNDITMNLFYYVFSALCLIVLFYRYGIKTRTSSCSISLGWRTHSLLLCRDISLILRTHETSQHKQLICSPQTDQTLTCFC